MATEIFSAGEQARLRAWPSEIGPGALVRYFTLDADDLGWLSRTARGETNRFGLAVQLCALPWLGFVPDDVAAVPAAVAARLAPQLGSSATALGGYDERAQTRTDHFRLVGERLGWRTAGPAEWKDVAEFLLARAIEHDSPSLLFGLVCEFCTGARIIRPGPVALMRTVATARERAATEVFLRVEPLLGGTRRDELDGLLQVEDPLPVSRLAWLHRGGTSASPMAIRAELDKLRYLREIDAHRLDLSMLPAALRRRLAGIGRRSTNQALTRRDETRRYPVLLATVAECAIEVLDEIVGMFDQAVSGTENRARRKLDDLLAARARSSEQRLDLLEEILTVATDSTVPDAEVGPRLREGIGMDRLAGARRDPRDRLPRDHGHLGLIDASFAYLREFVPHVIAAVEFTASPQATSVVTAVGVLRELYARGGRKVPDDAPTGFVPDPVARLPRRRRPGQQPDRLSALLGAVHAARATRRAALGGRLGARLPALRRSRDRPARTGALGRAAQRVLRAGRHPAHGRRRPAPGAGGAARRPRWPRAGPRER